VNLPDGGSAFSSPLSADIRGRRILIGIVENDTAVGGEGVPAAWSTYGLLSTDDGEHWTSTPTHVGGFLVGALFKSDERLMVAEAWDQRQYDPPFATLAHERLRFHTGRP